LLRRWRQEDHNFKAGLDKVSQTLSQKNSRGIAQVTDHLPSNLGVLGSILSTEDQNKKRKSFLNFISIVVYTGHGGAHLHSQLSIKLRLENCLSLGVQGQPGKQQDAMCMWGRGLNVTPKFNHIMYY
jgi:hypothetical protein